MRNLYNYIHGVWSPSLSRDRIALVNPATEETIALLPAGSEGDVDAAVRSAARAGVDWASTPLEDRLRLLEEVAVKLTAHIDELAEIEATEMGRPIALGTMWIKNAVGAFRESLDLARRYPFTRDDGSNTIIRRRPIGVVALITPWNFPTNVILPALGPMLASGDTVVLKPSEKSPLSAVRLIELLDLPPGVVNLLLGDGRAGAPLANHPDVGLTNFTGSVRAGRTIALASAGHMRRAVLELGGKDPVIVDVGVDVETVARDVARGAFVNTGQICTSMERIYVHRDIASRFIDALVAEAGEYDYGDPSTTSARMGPLVDAQQREVVVSHVEDAVASGATIRAGGKSPQGRGFFYPATVLTEVTDDMAIMREETFGPVAPVQVVDTFEEALAKANASDLGLAATVYSNNPANVAAAQHIEAGIIWINQWQGGGTGIVFEPARNSGLTPTGDVGSFDAATRPVAVLHNAVPTS